MTTATIHLAGRIDQITRDYFDQNSEISKLQAKELMPLFIGKGIFNNNKKNGLPIRNILRELDKVDALGLIYHCHPERKSSNTNWFFATK